MKGLFGYEISEDDTPKDLHFPKGIRDNPMIAAYGPYTVTPDVKCKDCKFLFYKQFARRYYKCEHRGNTNGAATDHRKHWPACSKYKKRDGDIEQTL